MISLYLYAQMTCINTQVCICVLCSVLRIEPLYSWRWEPGSRTHDKLCVLQSSTIYTIYSSIYKYVYMWDTLYMDKP